MLPCPILVPPTRPAGARCRGPTVCRQRDVDTGRDRCMARPSYGTRASSVRSVGAQMPACGFWGRTPALPRDLPHTSMSVACVIISRRPRPCASHMISDSWSCTSTRSCTCCFSVALSRANAELSQKYQAGAKTSQVG